MISSGYITYAREVKNKDKILQIQKFKIIENYYNDVKVNVRKMMELNHGM